MKKHEKSWKDRLNIKPKSIKKPSKNQCEKNVDFKVGFSSIFIDLLVSRGGLFTFGKEG